jgi:hypothetical protein
VTGQLQAPPVPRSSHSLQRLLRPPDDDSAHMHAGEVLKRATIWEIDSAQGVPYSADSWETITGWLVLFRGVAEVD